MMNSSFELIEKPLPSITIYKPRNAHQLYQYCHKGDTFREIIDMWEERGYVNVQIIDGQMAESGLVWYFDSSIQSKENQSNYLIENQSND